MAKVSISVPIEKLIEDKEKLQQALLNDEALKVRRPTRNGFEWYVMDRHTIKNKILKLDLEIERLQFEEKQREADILSSGGSILKGEKVIEFFEGEIAKILLKKNEPFIKIGKEKKIADKKRGDSNKKAEKQCPADHFKFDIVQDMLTFLGEPDVEAIGLFLRFFKDHRFGLKSYTAQSLSTSFHDATGIPIPKTTWTKWKKQKALISRKKRFETIFKKFLQ